MLKISIKYCGLSVLFCFLALLFLIYYKILHWNQNMVSVNILVFIAITFYSKIEKFKNTFKFIKSVKDLTILNTVTIVFPELLFSNIVILCMLLLNFKPILFTVPFLMLLISHFSIYLVINGYDSIAEIFFFFYSLLFLIIGINIYLVLIVCTPYLLIINKSLFVYVFDKLELIFNYKFSLIEFKLLNMNFLKFLVVFSILIMSKMLMSKFSITNSFDDKFDYFKSIFSVSYFFIIFLLFSKNAFFLKTLTSTPHFNNIQNRYIFFVILLQVIFALTGAIIFKFNDFTYIILSIFSAYSALFIISLFFENWVGMINYTSNSKEFMILTFIVMMLPIFISKNYFQSYKGFIYIFLINFLYVLIIVAFSKFYIKRNYCSYK